MKTINLSSTKIRFGGIEGLPPIPIDTDGDGGGNGGFNFWIIVFALLFLGGIIWLVRSIIRNKNNYEDYDKISRDE